MKVAVFGGTFNPLHVGHAMLADTIVKEERNFISPRVFEQTGLAVTHDGGKAVIKMPGVKVNNKPYDGCYHNGRTFIALEDYEKAMGMDVGWNGDSVIIKGR